jgi:hypothetical protein
MFMEETLKGRRVQRANLSEPFTPVAIGKTAKSMGQWGARGGRSFSSAGLDFFSRVRRREAFWESR